MSSSSSIADWAPVQSDLDQASTVEPKANDLADTSSSGLASFHSSDHSAALYGQVRLLLNRVFEFHASRRGIYEESVLPQFCELLQDKIAKQETMDLQFSERSKKTLLRLTRTRKTKSALAGLQLELEDVERDHAKMTMAIDQARQRLAIMKHTDVLIDELLSLPRESAPSTDPVPHLPPAELTTAAQDTEPEVAEENFFTIEPADYLDYLADSLPWENPNSKRQRHS